MVSSPSSEETESDSPDSESMEDHDIDEPQRYSGDELRRRNPPLLSTIFALGRRHGANMSDFYDPLKDPHYAEKTAHVARDRRDRRAARTATQVCCRFH